MSARGDATKMLEQLRSLGWRVEGGASRHYRLIPPDGGRIQTVTCSPTDPRAFTHLRRIVKQATR